MVFVLGRNLCRNYLSGSIPMEWASMPYLTNMSALSLSFCSFSSFENFLFMIRELTMTFHAVPSPRIICLGLYLLVYNTSRVWHSCTSHTCSPLGVWLLIISLILLYCNEFFRGVEANQFSGPIPDELGNLTNLIGL